MYLLKHTIWCIRETVQYSMDQALFHEGYKVMWYSYVRVMAYINTDSYFEA